MIYFARVQTTRNKDTVPVCDVIVETSGMVIKDCALMSYGTGSSDGIGGIGLIRAGTRVVVALMGGASMAGPGVILGIVPSNAVAAQLLSNGQASDNNPANVFQPTDGKASPGDTVLYRNGPSAILANGQSIRMKATSFRVQVSETEGQWVLGTADGGKEVESAIHGEQLVAYLESMQSTLDSCVSLVNVLLTVFQTQQAAIALSAPVTVPQVVGVLQTSFTEPTPIAAQLPVGSPDPVPDGLTSAILKFERVPEEDV